MQVRSLRHRVVVIGVVVISFFSSSVSSSLSIDFFVGRIDVCDVMRSMRREDMPFGEKGQGGFFDEIQTSIKHHSDRSKLATFLEDYRKD